MASPHSMSHLDPEHEAKPLGFMIVGDSISHGREGDYTWRYRIWEWLHTAAKKHQLPNEEVHFVGPYQGTYPPEKPSPPHPPPLQDEHQHPPPQPSNPPSGGGYALDVRPEFLDPTNSSHASANGLQVLQAKALIAEQVRIYQPDICLVQLGFNDLGWRVTGPEDTLRSMRELVVNARSAKPDLKFAVANVPFRTAIFGFPELPDLTSDYNNLLEKAIEHDSDLDTAMSPVKLVRFCENYECGLNTSKASYDGLHPNELGEYQLARAFSQTLIFPPFNLGHEALSIPEHIPPRPTPTPQNFKATLGPSGIVVTWDHVYGARWYELRSRLVPPSSYSSTSTSSPRHGGEEIGQAKIEWTTHRVNSPRFDAMRCLPGQKYEYQVRTCAGDTLHSPWSERISAIVRHDSLGTAPGPRDIITHATPTGFSISWTPPPKGNFEIDRYGVWWWEIRSQAQTPTRVSKNRKIKQNLKSSIRDLAGGQTVLPSVVGVKGSCTKATISGPGLVPGRMYGIAVDTWTKYYGAGLFAGAKSVIVGRGVPLAPASVKVEKIGDREVDVELSWKADTDTATAFRVWVRSLESIRSKSSLGNTVSSIQDELDGCETWPWSKSPYLIPTCNPNEFVIRRGNPQLVCEISAPREIPRVSTTCHNIRIFRHLVRGLTPSVWEFEFAVSALNGSDESPLSEWVRVPPRDDGDISRGLDGHGDGCCVLGVSCQVVSEGALSLTRISETDSLEIAVGMVAE